MFKDDTGGVFLWDGLRVENGVFIGPNATFTNDPFPRSRKHPSELTRTRVREGASIGANATILPGLTDTVEEQFGEGARYSYRLHPPVLRALGVRRKISLGPWFRPVFRGLAASRRVRGTALDPFGRTEVRRTERELVEDYFQLIDDVLAGLNPSNYATAIELLSLPDLVRGYEQIKLDNVAVYRARKDELLQQFLQQA